MIRIDYISQRRGGGQLSVIIPATKDYLPKAEPIAKYLVRLDCPEINTMFAIPEDEEYSECRCKNAGAEASPTELIAFSNSGVYPAAGVVWHTIHELLLDPSAIVIALRMDGTEDGDWKENQYALGDWQAMTKTTWRELGGYDEDFDNAGYIEYDMLVRAYISGRRIVLLDERVWHNWHPKPGKVEYRTNMLVNKYKSIDKGLPLVIFKYPEMAVLIYEDRVEPLLICSQEGSIRPSVPHRPLTWQFTERDYPLIPGTGDGISDQVGDRYRPVMQYIRDKTVLDWGCGTAYGSLLLSKCAKHVTGYDTGPDTVLWSPQYASEKLTIALEPPEGVFDVVTCCECIEHVPDPEVFMIELKKHVGELLYITTPIAEDGLQRNPFHISNFTRDSFEQFLRRHFDSVKFLPIITAGGALCQVALCRRVKS